jgi:[acyl-carrier-protein] S-malonyltransferase/trans-AT polyketide synthase/acyltransferase/oxidoreductase domain-containing protein
MDGTRTAVVFPGQGTQRKGMGEDFFNALPECRQVYEEAADTLGWNVADMCFRDDLLINLTEYAQPCIFTTEMAMYRGLQDRYGLTADYFGGHSVGEYAALTAAGVLSFPAVVKIVQARGRLMQSCFPAGAGGMSAVIGEDLDAGLIRRVLATLPVDVANINSAGQVVISGRIEALEEAEQRITRAAGDPPSLRFVRLNVSAPFHSRFMAAIEEPFRACLEEAGKAFHAARADRVTSNYTGNFHPAVRQTVIDNLVFQISGTVRWRENMDRLAEKAETFIEVGPHRPLKPFFASINVACGAVTSLAAAEKMFGVVSGKEKRHVLV